MVHFLETGSWEEHLEEIFRAALPSRDSVFVDVGAHVGIHSLRAKKYTDEIIAFEPNSVTSQYTTVNFAINRIPPERVKEICIGSYRGTATLFLSDISSGLSSVVPGYVSGGAKEIEVPISTLDAEIPMTVSLIKIDVEGYEPEGIAGGLVLIKRSKPVLIAEVHSRITAERICKTLRDNEIHYRYLLYNWPVGKVRDLGADLELLPADVPVAGDLVLLPTD